MNRYSLHCKIKREGITEENLRLFSENYNLEFLNERDLMFVCDMFHFKKNKKIISYVNELKHNFSSEQYIKYFNFRNEKGNLKDNSSLRFFNAKYGEELGKIKFEEKNKKTSGALERFINKYGETEGRERYNLKCKRNGFRGTLEGFIDLYRKKEGTKRYNLWCERNKGNFTLERMIEIYGEVEGKKHYEECQYKLKNKNTLEYYKKRFGDEEGTKKYREKNLKNSESTKIMKNAIWRIGSESYHKWLKIMKEKGLGHGIPFEERAEFKKYYKNVWRETLKQPLNLLPNFELRNHQRVKGSFAIDHKISIYFGFYNKIPYNIIGNIDNLQMLPHSLNSKKSINCYSVLEYCLHKVVGDRFDDFRF